MIARITLAAVIASVSMDPLSALASPPSFQGIGVGTTAKDLSGDGRVVVGLFGGWVNGVTSAMGGLGAYQDVTWTATSADGSVVIGTALTQPALSIDALRWANDTVTFIGHQAGKFYFATDITADGNTVVGWGSEGGFRWNDGARTPVCIDPGDANTIVLGISNDGSIMIGTPGTIQMTSPWLAMAPSAGEATGSEGEASNGSSFYRWVNGVPKAIGQMPGGYPGVAYTTIVELSGDGSTIVGTMTPLPLGEWDPNAQTTSSIWRVGIGWRELTDVLIDECHLDLTGWARLAAIGVSDDGLTIVGNGKNPQGLPEAWIAHIPEPTTAILLPCLFGPFWRQLRTERWRQQA